MYFSILMKRTLLSAVLSGFYLLTHAQPPAKKPLDHSVYDSWQSIGTKVISNNGQILAYTITPQEGDPSLVIYNTKSNRQITVPRGSTPVITEDNRYVVFAIRPPFAVTRQAKIKKKKAADMPKDSLGILYPGADTVYKTGTIRNFKTPEKGSGVLAYLLEKPQTDTSSGNLVILDLSRQQQDTIKNVQDYVISKNGHYLLAELVADKKDSTSVDAVLRWDIAGRKADTLSRGSGNRQQLAFDETGKQAAWVSTRDSAKALQQFYQLYYYTAGQDTGRIVADRQTKAFPAEWSVSQYGKVWFSRNGERLFFGSAPIQPAKDTNIVEFEVAKVDVWNYLDDYLQPMQLKNLEKELQRNYLAVYFPANNKVLQLADKDVENVVIADEGNSEYGIAYTDKGQRVAMQWTGGTRKTSYLLHVADAARKLIIKDLDSTTRISPGGKYVTWYDLLQRHYFAYETATGITRNITEKITTPLYEEDDDMPETPGSYGIAAWLENDAALYIYDRYDIWKVDPSGKQAPAMITGGVGRQQHLVFRYVKLSKDERFLKANQQMILETYNDITKENGYYSTTSTKAKIQPIVMGPYYYTKLVKAEAANYYIYQKENYQQSPDVYAGTTIPAAVQLSHLNPQQQDYNWGTASLFKWTAYNGQPAEGILYKPEDFDSTKKYPVIMYFYEKLSDVLYWYVPPAPTPSRLNISFFVSRGYLVLVPDIHYEKGHPGQGAYDYVVSGARALATHPWADSTKMGIQGQSWGGYQVSYLVTRTHLFSAAWAGAPVANMTSAYGGIRWESGMNRQFQYERSQSRIGSTLWEKPELYIENSPLFQLPNVTTPVAIMANDADGAVPWYQGIELFTGLRRLGKPVWMLNYNNEAHNLVQRQNRKDISRREQQFFDHFLKGAAAPEWMSKGVPAVEKGRNWGWE
jgi:dipeptidyl aminopeptidase/acylaminoacyl peptidase